MTLRGEWPSYFPQLLRPWLLVATAAPPNCDDVALDWARNDRQVLCDVSQCNTSNSQIRSNSEVTLGPKHQVSRWLANKLSRVLNDIMSNISSVPPEGYLSSYCPFQPRLYTQHWIILPYLSWCSITLTVDTVSRTNRITKKRNWHYPRPSFPMRYAYVLAGREGTGGQMVTRSRVFVLYRVASRLWSVSTGIWTCVFGMEPTVKNGANKTHCGRSELSPLILK